ncbi:NAD-binding protein [bacterium]|nr:NAD-binding protein [bacterium]
MADITGAATCAFLGLGVMGGPMARHLVAKGRDVAVWNRTEARMSAWREGASGGRLSRSPAEGAAGAEFVFLCLGDDPDVDNVFGQMEAGLSPGAVVVDHSTGSAALARRLNDRCKARGAWFLDAPVSGGQAGAENGVLTVMVGGDASAVERARPIIAAYARQVTHIGESGSGQLAKSVNQICIAGLLQGLAEGVHFAEAAGLDPMRVLEAISKGAAQSWQMENRWAAMVDRSFEFGFAVDWMRKDLRIALDAARRSGASTPVTALVDQFYADVQKLGGARWDTSSLAARAPKPERS